MSYRSLTTLLTCHSLEDFPTYPTGDAAQGLLAAWCAPWHPDLIAAAGQAPQWRRVEEWTALPEHSLLLVPGVTTASVQDDWPDAWKAAGHTVISDQLDAPAMQAQALEQAGIASSATPPEFVADFLALGYWYLQVQLLTRQMRYSSNLDEDHFRQELLQAALATTAGDTNRAEEHLSRCFGILAEERDHYYPVDAFLIDLILLAPAVADERFAVELREASATNVWATARTWHYLSQHQPHILGQVQETLAAGKMSVLGGELDELPWPLVSAETVRRELREGIRECTEILGSRPRYFARRRFGMSADVPQLLDHYGYQGALHATLDDGRFPTGSQSRARWQGIDGTTIDTLCSVPLDAGRPETFLNLAVRMGESMELDYVATVCLAHWPGGASPWLDALRRGARYGLALGKFVTLQEYFEHTSYTSQTDVYEADKYRSPYLRQLGHHDVSDIVSRGIEVWRIERLQESLHNLQTLACCLGETDMSVTTTTDDRLDPTASEPAIGELIRRQDQLRSQLNSVAKRLAQRLSRPDQPEGTLAINPWSSSCRTWLNLPPDSGPTPESYAPSGPIYAATETQVAAAREALPDENNANAAAPQPSDHTGVVLDTLALGYSWFAVSPDAQPTVGESPGKFPWSRPKRPSPIAEETRLRNEFVEVSVDPATGGLRSLHDFKTRGNRLSQRLVCRDPLSPPDARGLPFTEMRADKIEIVESSPVRGRIVSTGRVLDRRELPVADYRQAFTLTRGSRVVDLRIELHPRRPIHGDPWETYFASRWAWADESNSLYRELHGARQSAEAKRFEAPTYIEIESASQRTYLLNGGITYHRRLGLRMLDSLLIVPGESRQTFEIGVGVELRQPMVAAWTRCVPPVTVTANRPAVDQSWFLHIDARNVVLLSWEPLTESADDNDGDSENNNNGGNGDASKTDAIAGTSETPRGVRLYLVETEGRGCRVKVRSFRDFRSAARVDFSGNELFPCEVKDGAASTELAGYEWFAMDAWW
ncbi:MAG: hypothetical protein KDA60_01390 [Planctomycetales bacterium]|nr:hypothetical protein [Planctomycetales bacterium]